MFATVFTQLTGLLDRNFVLNALLPALVSSIIGLLVVLAGADGVDAGLDAWGRQDGMVQTALVILAVAWLFALATLISSQTLTIVRAFEGYIGPFRWLRQFGEAWHERRRKKWLSKDRYDRVATEYALGSDTLPTRLGNILLSGERYPYERYGADAVVLWPRMVSLLTDADKERLAAVRSVLERLLVLATLSVLLSIGSGICFAVSELPWQYPFFSYTGGLALAWTLYEGALGPAVGYSAQLKAIFDLRRLELLEALRAPTPMNRHEERRRWAAINQLIYRNNPDVSWPYVPNHNAEGG